MSPPMDGPLLSVRDLKTFFINIQHPGAGWPSNVQGNSLPARSATIVVRRTDGRAVGA